MRQQKTYENSGIAFKNLDKEQDQIELEKRFPNKDVTAPDMRGNATVAGQEYFMDVYFKEGQKGRFMSFKFKPKTGKPPARQPEKKHFDYEDDIPF